MAKGAGQGDGSRTSSEEEDDEMTLAERQAQGSQQQQQKEANGSEAEEEDSDEGKAPAEQKQEDAETLAQRRERRWSSAASSLSTVQSPRKKRKTDRNHSASQPGHASKKQYWSTLEHSGPLFPPEYEPHGVKMKYEGEEVDLSPEEEEIATFYGHVMNTEYPQKQRFRENFWSGFRSYMTPETASKLRELDKCDFSPIFEHIQSERERKKNRSKEEKKQEKEEKEEQEKKYMYAKVDGRWEKVGNFRIEPPGLFRGRGEHPKMGMIKKRIHPEDVVINIGEDAPVPDPGPGHEWGRIVHNKNVTWLAGWKDSINTKDWKYVQFSPSSTIKGESDQKKYDTARKLKRYIDDIREDYMANLKSSDPATRQLAVTTYLVDALALRAGGEKDDDLADTVGVCTLRVSHVKFISPDRVEFDFLGKDAIRYHQEHRVNERVWSCMKEFAGNKRGEDNLFDKIDPARVNRHLQSLMPGLTIKVFRTFNASRLLQKKLREETDDSEEVDGKKAKYDNANKEVAVMCNHQKDVSKQHDQQMKNLQDKLDKMRSELESAKEEETKKAATKVANLEQRIKKHKLKMSNKENLKQVSLGTAKINYCDPRITIAWCKRHEVPIAKVYPRALLEKFSWCALQALLRRESVCFCTCTDRSRGAVPGLCEHRLTLIGKRTTMRSVRPPT